ncbi:MAG: glycosyltransferase family 2 protein [Planctomycetia bacterium]|nr:glycosyltransferase family 2 protein [Planctomycetia bacterium]
MCHKEWTPFSPSTRTLLPPSHLPSSIPFEPKTAVILTLRGADPSLNACIEGLLNQKYRDFTIFFVVDSPTDPALTVVKKLLKASELPQNPGRKYKIIIANEHRETCSLKCNSLVHVISALDGDFSVIALLDADTQPSPNWLHQLVEPLSDPHFSATSGLRWYIPERDNFGSLIRMLWNIAAVNQMVFSQIPWGGSLAIRRDVFQKTDLLTCWSHSLSDDVPLFSVIRALNSHTLVTPSLLMVNHETCGLPAFYPWVKRQLLMAKLYHPMWICIVIQAFLLTLPILLALFLSIIGLYLRDFSLILWNFSAFCLYIFGVLGAFLIMDHNVRAYLRTQGKSIPHQTFRRLIKTLISIPLTQFVYTLAIFCIFRQKKLKWRGISYTFTAPYSVRLEKYLPYSAQTTPSAHHNTDSI